jgi:hypothetical protein
MIIDQSSIIASIGGVDFVVEDLGTFIFPNYPHSENTKNFPQGKESIFIFLS